MATFYKRDGKWRAQIETAKGRKSKSFRTKKQAQEWALYYDDRDHCDIPFYEFAQRYMCEVTDHKKDWAKARIRINRLIKEPFAKLLMSEITPKDIALFQQKLKESVSAGTVNRYIGTISAIFNYAIKDLFLMKTNPCSLVRRLKEPKPRDRRISEQEIATILHALNYHEHRDISEKRQEVALMFLLAIESGMRLGEICKLKWQDISLSRCFVTVQESKNGDKRTVALSSKAVGLLGKMASINGDKVFSLNNDNASALFRKYLKATKIVNLHFHDTRHEAITRLARKLDVLDLARMIGHRDIKSLMIYYNPTAEEIAKRPLLFSTNFLLPSHII